MKTTRLVFALLLGLTWASLSFATEWAFMGFDEIQQKMFIVVKSDVAVDAYISVDQTDAGGWIGNYVGDSYSPTEYVGVVPLAPDDPSRATIVPDGDLNVIIALVDIYDENQTLRYTMEVTDTLESNVQGDVTYYSYRQGTCTWNLPTVINVNSAFCATICHGTRTVPIFCEDPGYNPALLEVTVTNGCLPVITHCNTVCTPVDWNLFSYRKYVFPGCHLFLEMTYCGEGPGCVCIWRSDFFLPVSMAGFNAVAGDHSVTLNWRTNAEVDEAGSFVIARSTDRDGVYNTVYSTDLRGTSATGASYSWTDESVQNGTTYFYKLHVVDANNNGHVYEVVAEATPNEGLVPLAYNLAQNYPNPFNSTTTFNFALATSDRVTLKVFDLLGREVATVLDRTMDAGPHTLNWTADGLATGVYLYTLTTNGYSDTKKLLFLK